ncbi:unnamed protein product [Staurois parvus]|uniref:Uncharacterized protein n=1 Tax=Staurois parvus TaxID=386267 RepID=A0ABN9BTB1_9NEOB|nr:unnamed protein product [Staurois parvus]
MGPYLTAASSCLHRHMPCATFSVSSHTAGVFEFFDIGCWQIYGPPIAACQAPNLPWAPIYRLLMLLPVQSLSWVPVRPPIAAVSIATLCHVPLSGLLTHCWCVQFF